MELALIFIIYIMWKESKDEYNKVIRTIRNVNDKRISSYVQSIDEDGFPNER